jgi:hypothetical protein
MLLLLQSSSLNHLSSKGVKLAPYVFTAILRSLNQTVAIFKLRINGTTLALPSG